MLVENKPDAAAQLAPAERSERIKKQGERLQGLALAGELECSYSCYEQIMQLQANNSVVYLPPHKFPSRRSELAQDKPRKEIILDSGSTLKVQDKLPELTCDTASELLLTQALARRALAMDLMQLASYKVMEAYNALLMSHMQAPQILGYSKVNVQQILKADQQAWVRLAEKLKDGVRRRADGTLPMDEAIRNLENDPQFTFFLLPLPTAHKRVLDESYERPAKSAVRSASSGAKGSSGKGGGKSKKTKQWKPPKGMPQELTSKQSSTKAGKRICWAFNLECGCDQAKPGEECPRGLHVCMEPGCQKNHSLVNHR